LAQEAIFASERPIGALVGKNRANKGKHDFGKKSEKYRFLSLEEVPPPQHYRTYLHLQRDREEETKKCVTSS
jgi:hypothetical protein